MRIEDLRVDDLVVYQGNIVKVLNTEKDLNNHVKLGNINTNKVYIWASIHYLSGVPLTDEILENNGWIKQYEDDRIYWENNIDPLSLGRFTKNTFAPFSVYYGDNKHFIGVRIKYVHELQHIIWALKLDYDIKV